MNYKMYLWTMLFGTIVAWIGWFIVLFRINPAEAGPVGLILFYATLFVSCVGILTLLGTLYRIRSKTEVLINREVKIAFRHAVLLAFATVISLVLSAQALLFWWNALGLFVLVGAIEYLFLLAQEGRR